MLLSVIQLTRSMWLTCVSQRLNRGKAIEAPEIPHFMLDILDAVGKS
jgi:hypothetical protein